MRPLLVVIAFCAGAAITAPGVRAATVAEYEFNDEERTEGWRDRGKGTGIDNLTSDGQSLVGTSRGVDPQLASRRALHRAAFARWDKVTFRVRETESPGGEPIEFDPAGSLVQINGGGRKGLTVVQRSAFTIEESGDGFYTVTVSIAAFPGKTINELRIDPIGGTSKNSNSDTAGNTFEIDFIRVTDSARPPAKKPG